MAHMSPVPDDSSSSLTLPSVDWMPLDGLVMQWTQTLSALEWPRVEALQASSTALHALSLETTARHSYLSGETVRTWTPPTPELVGQHLLQAFLELVEAHRHWQAVGEWLQRLARECRREERACYPLLCELYRSFYAHQSYLCQLLARVAAELVPVTEQVQQARTQSLAQTFGIPEQEETA